MCSKIYLLYIVMSCHSLTYLDLWNFPCSRWNITVWEAITNIPASNSHLNGICKVKFNLVLIYSFKDISHQKSHTWAFQDEMGATNFRLDLRSNFECTSWWDSFSQCHFAESCDWERLKDRRFTCLEQKDGSTFGNDHDSFGALVCHVGLEVDLGVYCEEAFAIDCRLGVGLRVANLLVIPSEQLDALLP